MRGGDRGEGVTSPSSSASSEESDSEGVSSPRSFTARWAALRACFFSFHAHIFSLWSRFASHLAVSSGKLVLCNALRAPLRPYAWPRA
jgi:hypothetical protein